MMMIKGSHPFAFGERVMEKPDIRKPIAHTAKLNVVVTGPQRHIYTFFGLVFVGLAALGALLPVLPTTPFLILASTCFMRSSPEWQRWLMRLPVWGPVLRDWETHRAVKPHTKRLAVVILVFAVAASAIVGQLSPLLLAVVFSLATVGLIVVLRLPVLVAASRPGSQLRKREMRVARSQRF